MISWIKIVLTLAKKKRFLKLERNRKSTSIVKAISWRLIGTIDTMILSYLLTSSFKISFSIGGIELFSKMILFYFHERVWTKMTY